MLGYVTGFTEFGGKFQYIIFNEEWNNSRYKSIGFELHFIAICDPEQFIRRDEWNHSQASVWRRLKR